MCDAFWNKPRLGVVVVRREEMLAEFERTAGNAD